MTNTLAYYPAVWRHATQHNDIQHSDTQHKRA